MVHEIIDETIQVLEELKHTRSDQILEFASLCCVAIKSGKRLYFIGNGGSAADCQHLVAELVGSFERKGKGSPAIALTTNTSIITALGNDYGFDDIFSRQVDALVAKDDVLIAISTSGMSPNIIKAARAATQKGAKTVALTGAGGGKLAAEVDLCIRVPSAETPRIQEAHILIGHIVCHMIEEALRDV
jgi:D-sedoheptulose 7-phosphate isomerase